MRGEQGEGEGDESEAEVVRERTRVVERNLGVVCLPNCIPWDIMCWWM